MPTFRCLSRLLWIVPLALGLSNCAVMDEALVPNNAAILGPHTTAQETTVEPPRAVAINHFKRTKQLLTDRQQSLVKEVYSAISQQPQDINMMRLTSSVNAIQTYISSTAPAELPSMLFLALGDGFFQLNKQKGNADGQGCCQTRSANKQLAIKIHLYSFVIPSRKKLRG